MFPTNSERLIGNADAFSAFVYEYPSSCPRARYTPNKSAPTLRYTRRPGPVLYIYTGHACRHLPSAVHWISEDRLLEEGAGKRCSECEALPDLVTPLKGHAVFISAQLSTDAVSALRKVLLLI